MSRIELALEWFCNNIIWGTPMVILIFGAGIYLSNKINFLQITHLGLIFKKTVGALFKKRDKKSSDGSVSQLGVVSTALAATIGTGNIVGVGTAVALGGPGAVFWCWLTGVLGMSTKYAEGLLAVKYRVNSEGRMLGGPMYAIENGLSSARYENNAKMY